MIRHHLFYIGYVLGERWVSWQLMAVTSLGILAMGGISTHDPQDNGGRVTPSRPHVTFTGHFKFNILKMHFHRKEKHSQQSTF